MMVYDLTCAGGHTFEGWFRSSADFEGQVEAGEIACPECGDHHVVKGFSAPRINGGARSEPVAGPCGLPACAGGTCALQD